MFKCSKCNKEFKLKHHLDKHLKRKIPCDNIIQCNNCLKIFKTTFNLKRHQDRKIKCEKIDLEQENQQLKEEVEYLKRQLIINNPNSINQTNINNQTINNQTINININNFGNEDLSKLPINKLERDLKSVLSMIEHKKLKEVKIGVPMENDLLLRNSDFKPFKIFIYFLTMIYKNDKFPQNKTIKYNQETKKFEHHLDNVWNSIEDKDIIDEIILKITENIGELLIDKTPIKNENILYYLKHYLGEDYDINKNLISGRTLSEMSNCVKIPYKNYLHIAYNNENQDKIDNLHNYVIKLK